MSYFHVARLTTEGRMSGEDEKRFNELLCAGKRSFDVAVDFAGGYSSPPVERGVIF